MTILPCGFVIEKMIIFVAVFLVIIFYLIRQFLVNCTCCNMTISVN